MPPKTRGIAVLPQLPLCFGKLRKTLRDRAGLQRGASSLGRRQSFRQSARPACRGSCLQLAAPGRATLDWSLLTKRGTFVFSGANPLALLAGVCPRTQLQPLGRVGEGGLRYAPGHQSTLSMFGLYPSALCPAASAFVRVSSVGAISCASACERTSVDTAGCMSYVCMLYAVCCRLDVACGVPYLQFRRRPPPRVRSSVPQRRSTLCSDGLPSLRCRGSESRQHSVATCAARR